MMRREWFLEAETPPDGGGGGGAPPPAAEPSTPTVDAPVDSGQDFATLNDSFDRDDGEDAGAAPQPPVAAPATPAEPAAPKPVPPPVPPPAPAQPQAVQPPVAPQVPQAAPPVPPPAQPAVAPTVAQPAVPQQAQLAELRTREMGRLQTLYAIPADQVPILATEPEKVLPEIAARLHLEVVDSVINGIMAQMPQLLEHYTTQVSSRKEAEDAFFGMWPALKNPQYKAAVGQAILAHRQAAPTATREEVMRAAGLQVMLQHRLPLPREVLGVEQQPQQQPQPHTITPPTPANPGGGSRVLPQNPQSANPFTVLAEEFIDDDRR